MVNKNYIFVFAIFAALIATAFFVSAAPTLTVWLNDTDNFYSNYTSNSVIHVLANVTNSSMLVALYANFTNFTTSCGTSGIVNLTNLSGNMWNASCNVSTLAATSNFVGGGISVVAVQSPGDPSNVTGDTSLRVVLYNMTTPTMPPGGCQRFGSQTTNFVTDVSNFAQVNFIVNIQNNFTCMAQMMGQSYPGSLSAEYLDVMIMNLTSVDLSNSTQAAMLSLLPTVLTLNISQPKVFPAITKISLDASAFTALNTNASIQLLNLPFTAKPNVSSNNLSELVNTTWVSNGYDPGFDVVTGNLTINVLGFTEYNASDIAYPLISFNSPASGSNVSSGNVSLSVLVNGTGTELSYISITNISGGTIYKYNDSSGTNTAGCQNISGDKETRNCTISFPVSSLQEGANTITVDAWDYGDIYGNHNSSAIMFNVDRTGPAVTAYSPAANTNLTSILFNISAVDATTSSASCWMTLDNGITNKTMTKSGNYFNYTNSSIAEGNYLAKYSCNDTLGNINNSVTTNFTVDTTAPSISLSFSHTETTITATATITESGSGISSCTSSPGSISGSGNSWTVSETGLNCGGGTSYPYVINCTDNAGNSNSTTGSYTTGSCTTTPSNGGVVDTFWTNTYTTTTQQAQVGFSEELKKGERIKIAVSGESHYVGIIQLSSTGITINISSTPQQAVFQVGDIKSFDVTNDSYYDIKVKLNSINSSYVNLTVWQIHEKMPTTPVTGAATTGATNAGAENATTTGAGSTSATSFSEITKNKWFWIGLAVVVLVVVGILYYLRRRKRTQGY